RVDAGATAAAMGGDLEAGAGAGGALRGLVGDAARIDRQHEHLVAEALGDLRDHLGAGDGGGVDPALVRAGAQQLVHVVRGTHAAADGQRDEDLLRRAAHHLDHGVPAAGRGGDVEEGELVGPLGTVTGGELHRVARIAQVLEVDPLDDASRVDVQAGDDSYGDTHASILSRSSSSAPSMMNCLRGATSEPISSSKTALAASASSIRTRRRVRWPGSMVVSASWSASISPRPL